jgi:hypothetical protein
VKPDSTKKLYKTIKCEKDITYGFNNTAGLSYKPTVLLKLSLSVQSSSRQYWLEHHCRPEPQARNVGLSIIAGSSHKPAVLA